MTAQRYDISNTHLEFVEPWPKPDALDSEQCVLTGNRLIRQGDVVRTLYLLKEGCLKLLCSDDSGVDRLVALRFREWLIGTSAAILSRPHAVSAEAITKTVVQSIPVDRFLTLLRTDSRVADWVQRMQSFEIYQQISLMGLSGSASTDVRLERLLVRLASAQCESRHDGSVRLVVRLRHEEMAQCICVARETVTRAITRLETKHELQREKGWLIFPRGGKIARMVLDAKKGCSSGVI